jgi:predicted TIM-barrel fold metal-dependent hydrolase
MPLVLAHAGWMAGANVIGPLLEAHPNVYVDLSVRLDPAVGGILAPGAVNQQSILTSTGRLQPEWRALIERFPDRFLFGLDVTGSDRPQHIDELVGVAKRALGELPRDVEASVAHGNTERLLRACKLSL